MNTLQFDLNEIVSKEVSEQIRELETRVINLSAVNFKQSGDLIILNEQLNSSLIAIDLLSHIRKEYSKINRTEEDSSGFFNSKQKNQFLFIEKILSSLFNIDKEYSGWYCSGSDGNLQTHLAVNYYTNKDTVIKLLDVLIPDSSKVVQFIKSFTMPYDYTRAEVLSYVSKPNYNTNGAIYGVSSYWIEGGAGKSNMPHDLIMRSKYIIERDVFDTLLNSIKEGRSNSYYLFAVAKYNKDISTEQVQQLGECLLSPNLSKWLFYDSIKEFISTNLKKFNNKTLDFFYSKTTVENQFKQFDWQKFPEDYQEMFLSFKPFEDILKIINNYSCTWTVERKESFLKEYLTTKELTK